jgi:hypothetical protein
VRGENLEVNLSLYETPTRIARGRDEGKGSDGERGHMLIERVS